MPTTAIDKLTEQQQKDLRAALLMRSTLLRVINNAYTLKRIAQRLNVPMRTITLMDKKLVHDGVIPPTPFKHSKVEHAPEILAKIQKLTEEGLSNRQIADKTGVAKSKVNDLQQIYGWSGWKKHAKT